MHGRPLTAAAVLALGLIVGSAQPSSAQMGQREGEGTAAGALLGGVLGGLIGGSGGRAVVGVVAGAAIGGLIGNRIGASLDEEDRRAMATATRAAAVSGKPKKFSSRKTGVRGTAQVVSTQQVDGRQCRTIKQEVVLKDGSVLNDTVNACKGARGWEV